MEYSPKVVPQSLSTGDLHNGSAADFESACGGSIPSSPTNF